MSYFQLVGCDKARVGYMSLLAKDIDHMNERDLERRGARRSFVTERERVIVSQTNIGTASTATLGKPLRDGVVQNGV